MSSSLTVLVWVALTLALFEESLLLYALCYDQIVRYNKHGSSNMGTRERRWTLLPLYKVYLHCWNLALIFDCVLLVSDKLGALCC